MKKILLRFCVSVLIVFFVMSNIGYAQSTTDRYVINVGDFTKLKVTDNINVVYSSNPDSIGKAVFSCTPEFADAVMFGSNGKGQLHIQVSTDDVDKKGLPTVYVYSTYLQKVESSSQLTVTIKDAAKMPEMNFKLIGNGRLIGTNIDVTKLRASLSTGNGSIILSGRCDKANLKMVGTGVIQADELQAEEVYCSILGTGSIGCNPENLLHVQGIGSTKIYYRGTPKEIKKSGGGKLIKLED